MYNKYEKLNNNFNEIEIKNNCLLNEINEKNIEIEFDDKREQVIFGDQEYIEQVVNNYKFYELFLKRLRLSVIFVARVKTKLYNCNRHFVLSYPLFYGITTTERSRL